MLAFFLRTSIPQRMLISLRMSISHPRLFNQASMLSMRTSIFERRLISVQMLISLRLSAHRAPRYVLTSISLWMLISHPRLFNQAPSISQRIFMTLASTFSLRMSMYEPMLISLWLLISVWLFVNRAPPPRADVDILVDVDLPLRLFNLASSISERIYMNWAPTFFMRTSTPMRMLISVRMLFSLRLSPLRAPSYVLTPTS